MTNDEVIKLKELLAGYEFCGCDWRILNPICKGIYNEMGFCYNDDHSFHSPEKYEQIKEIFKQELSIHFPQP